MNFAVSQNEKSKGKLSVNQNGQWKREIGNSHLFSSFFILLVIFLKLKGKLGGMCGEGKQNYALPKFQVYSGRAGLENIEFTCSTRVRMLCEDVIPDELCSVVFEEVDGDVISTHRGSSCYMSGAEFHRKLLVYQSSSGALMESLLRNRRGKDSRFIQDRFLIFIDNLAKRRRAKEQSHFRLI
ncbi:hypothetical protein AOLI_G00256610 [Acnodon oligacanthus]